MKQDFSRCSKCGDCCTYYGLVFHLKAGDPMYELLKAHYGREITRIQVRINHTCAQLVTVQGQRRCAIYDERPEICRNFLCKFANNSSDFLMFNIDKEKFDKEKQ